MVQGLLEIKLKRFIRDKLTESDKKELAAIIYYPKEKVEAIQNRVKL